MRSLRAWAASGLLCVWVAVLSIGLSAQSFQGGLRGVVKDPQGVIPGATVTLVNDQNGVSRETVTNGVGEYSFPAIEPALYTVRASVQGFKTFERKGVRIGTQEFLALDIQLEVGGLEETITVTGESPLIDTTNASTGDVLDTKSLESIPTPGRSVFLMANLQPTVQTSGNATGIACRIRSAIRPCRWAAVRSGPTSSWSTASRSPTCRTARRPTRRSRRSRT